MADNLCTNVELDVLERDGKLDVCISSTGAGGVKNDKERKSQSQELVYVLQ